MTLDADVILPITTATDQTYLMATVALRTCRASTSARILAFLNNSPPSPLRERIINQCQMLGIGMVFWDKPFSLTKIFNAGTGLTRGEFIAYGTSDVIYFPNWFENIVELWRENPEYFCLVNYSFDDLNMPCVQHSVVNERRIEHTGNPSSGVTIFKRSSNYVWDENFSCWEMDADLFYYLVHHKLKAGYCLDARCDHLINGVKSLVGGNWENPKAGEYLRAKWGLLEPA